VFGKFPRRHVALAVYQDTVIVGKIEFHTDS
jgi:hypothetical protein